MIGAVLLIGLAAWVALHPKSRTLPPPLVVAMRTASGKPTVSVFPGSPVTYFIFPDGSLWQWGASSPQSQPELVDRLHHWRRVYTRLAGWALGVDDSEEVWYLGRWFSPRLVSLPVTNYDGGEFTGGAIYALGLRRDGTLFGWEDRGGPSGRTVRLIDVHTNIPWRSVTANGPSCLGVSRDGRLWSWDRTAFSPLTFSAPVQEGGANWAGVSDGAYAWSSAGQLWGTPVTHLNSTSPVVGQFALGRIVHEIRADGSLWAAGPPGANRRQVMHGSVSYQLVVSASSRATFPWHRIGTRSDWVSVWASDETYFGLTSDGTVWVWGLDWGQEPIESMRDKLLDRWFDIQRAFQTKPAGATVAASQIVTTRTQPYLQEPRPLIKFESVK